MADNNEMFDLLTKMYSEVQGMKSDINGRLDNLDSKFDKLESKVDKLEDEVRKTNMTIENDIKPKIEALFDGYKQNTEVIYALTNKMDDLQTDVNNLTIRTLKNENNIIQISRH